MVRNKMEEDDNVTLHMQRIVIWLSKLCMYSKLQNIEGSFGLTVPIHHYLLMLHYTLSNLF